MAKYKVLSTKKLDPSLVEQAKENDIEIIEQEFISIKPIWTEEKFEEVYSYGDSEQRRKDYAAFTSSNAINAFKKYVHPKGTYYVFGWEIFCLAGKTLTELSEPYAKIIGKVVDTAVDAKSLAEKIIDHGVKEIVFFCGNKRRDELPNILKEAGIKVHEVVVYETIETPIVATVDFDAILFFSPSAVQSFFSVNQIKKTTVCFAIGRTTASSIADFTDNKIVVSESPGQEMILASVNFYFQNLYT